MGECLPVVDERRGLLSVSTSQFAGVALTVVSVSFLLSTLTYTVAMLRSREILTAPPVLYAVGAVPVSLRAFVPEVVLDLAVFYEAPNPSTTLTMVRC